VRAHQEKHRIERIGWLRAAVLGANDGIVSTASLVLGVAAAHAVHAGVVIAGVSGLVAGAMSMATGEYVSVSSQRDAENAALNKEREEIESDAKGEHRELAEIYVRRGLDAALAKRVSEQLMAKDALGAHARDELGISDIAMARPLQAAFASAGSFAAGAALPLLVAIFAPQRDLIWMLAGAALCALAFLGAIAARTGGAPLIPGILRVTFWSALAMSVTTTVGALWGRG
jgi:vacuolar iron transporter family protein